MLHGLCVEEHTGICRAVLAHLLLRRQLPALLALTVVRLCHQIDLLGDHVRLLLTLIDLARRIGLPRPGSCGVVHVLAVQGRSAGDIVELYLLYHLHLLLELLVLDALAHDHLLLHGDGGLRPLAIVAVDDYLLLLLGHRDSISYCHFCIIQMLSKLRIGASQIWSNLCLRLRQYQLILLALAVALSLVRCLAQHRVPVGSWEQGPVLAHVLVAHHHLLLLLHP